MSDEEAEFAAMIECARYALDFAPEPRREYCPFCRSAQRTMIVGGTCAGCGERRGRWPHPAFERIGAGKPVLMSRTDERR